MNPNNPYTNQKLSQVWEESFRRIVTEHLTKHHDSLGAQREMDEVAEVMSTLRGLRDYDTETVYWNVVDYIKNHSFAPTYREIGAACNLSHTHARRHVVKLVNAGLLRCIPGTKRHIRLSHKLSLILSASTRTLLRVPLSGEIIA